MKTKGLWLRRLWRKLAADVGQVPVYSTWPLLQLCLLSISENLSKRHASTLDIKHINRTFHLFHHLNSLKMNFAREAFQIIDSELRQRNGMDSIVGQMSSHGFRWKV
ncbi:uncharacterized protein isoform X1 [Rhodnius prolixus]|uniref:uncharacterized protein isoform X1 n=1 Tax=Rhodnius prolixus TaxID=13249 RepID=UPI003D18C16B